LRLGFSSGFNASVPKKKMAPFRQALMFGERAADTR
jgi:hypothetical protein